MTDTTTVEMDIYEAEARTLFADYKAEVEKDTSVDNTMLIINTDLVGQVFKPMYQSALTKETIEKVVCAMHNMKFYDLTLVLNALEDAKVLRVQQTPRGPMYEVNFKEDET